MNDRPQYIALIKAECLKRNLDPQLICAIVDTESAFNTWAVRYESGVMRPVAVSVCAKVNRISEDTETQCQRISWGLMQVLGSTLRWIGYRDHLPAICDPKQGIFWGCETFEKLGDPYKFREEKISAYNAGSVKKHDDGSFINQKYVDKVLQFYRGSKYE